MPALSRVGTAFFLNKPGGGSSASAGEAIFHADKGSQSTTWDATTNYTWTVPDGVTEISIVAVGGGGSGVAQHDGASGCGGGLAYKNQLAVVPGTTIGVVVGGGGGTAGWGNWGKKGDPSMITYNGLNICKAGGGNAQTAGQYGNGLINNDADGVPGGDGASAFDGGGKGGRGQQWGGSRQGGGGAGGYADVPNNNGGDAAGGDAGNPSYAGNWPTNGLNGAGGGASSANGSSSYYGNGGGGTGVYGRGSNGIRGDNNQNQNPDSEVDWAGGGGSYDPWTTETSGLTPNSGYVHNTGLTGYSSNSGWSTFHTHDQQSLGNDYRRDQEDGSGNQNQGQTRPDGGFPGGGGGGGHSGSPCGFGGHGMVRIIWGTINGLPRRFPTQGVNKTDQYPGHSEASITTYGNQMMY